jgi:hypothetical protein
VEFTKMIRIPKNLKRWFKEKWVDVGKKRISCLDLPLECRRKNTLLKKEIDETEGNGRSNRNKN